MFVRKRDDSSGYNRKFRIYIEPVVVDKRMSREILPTLASSSFRSATEYYFVGFHPGGGGARPVETAAAWVRNLLQVI